MDERAKRSSYDFHSFSPSRVYEAGENDENERVTGVSKGGFAPFGGGVGAKPPRWNVKIAEQNSGPSFLRSKIRAGVWGEAPII